MQRLKGGSAVIATRERHAHPDPLRWSKGYGIVSVSQGAVERVRSYVRSQYLRHPDQAIPGWPPAQSENRLPAARDRLLARRLDELAARATSRGSWPSRGFMPRSSRRRRPIACANPPWCGGSSPGTESSSPPAPCAA
jgi:hypothetical protein